MNIKFLAGVWRVLLALVFAFSLAGISAQEARASTYTVWNLNDTKAGSLRTAIINANNHSGLDVINFSVSGTILLGADLPIITDDLIIDGRGEDVTIDGNNHYRGLHLDAGKSLNINTLKITRGNGNYGMGGGILNWGGTLTIRNSSITESGSTRGGGIYNNSGTVTVINTSIDFNRASEVGAGIFNDHGILTISTSRIHRNSANGFVSFGGGLYNSGGTAEIISSTFSINTATDGGGGIVNTGDMTIANSTFYDNYAVDYGGGVYNSEGTLRLFNNTFSGNSAGIGSGVYSVFGTSLFYYNNILADSIGGEDCYSDEEPDGNVNNLVENSYGCGTPVSSADPRLGPLAANGGSTKTLGLLAGSPAIDAGHDGWCGYEGVNNKDQRGVKRPSGAHCDIGAYEAAYFRSSGINDGWILESGEDSSTGGTLNATGGTFNLGDDAADKQYRAILSFNTAGLPDNAVIRKVTLSLKVLGQMGSDPFALLGGLKVDIRKPFFGPTVGLSIGDFQAVAGKYAVGTFDITPTNGWYSAVIGNTAFPFINLTGTTQFRLRFQTGDNDNNMADYMEFFSGNSTTARFRPTLIIDY